MDTIKFTKDHEYVAIKGDIATIGISNYAQEQLGDVVFVELPEVGRDVEQGDEIAVVESVKAASEIYSPIGGTVTEINPALEGAPSTVNEAAEGDGWFFKLKIADTGELDGLMDRQAYEKFVAEIA
ncbi:Glycine cleavage system H protein [hydrothermal vent metagenome]|uniref:Glycine cleavage system H protein n=1 Tax=hydrothermal vent metagenome TaxID=652676 RepID=A0A3B0SYG4_9ZZZZ